MDFHGSFFKMQNYSKPRLCNSPSDTLFFPSLRSALWPIKPSAAILASQGPESFPALTELGPIWETRSDLFWLLGRLFSLAMSVNQGPHSNVAVSQVRRLLREERIAGSAKPRPSRTWSLCLRGAQFSC